MSTPGARKIIEEIEKTAASQSGRIIAEAKEKADEVVQQAQKKASEEEKIVLSRGEQEARRESQRILAEARIKARREKVRAQEEIVRRCFERAQGHLKTLAEQHSHQGMEYKKVLARLLRESIDAAGADSLEVLANPRDHELLKGILPAASETKGQEGTHIALTISPEGIHCVGGLAVRSADGKIKVDNTFEARFKRFREILRTQAAQQLFSGAQPDGQ